MLSFLKSLNGILVILILGTLLISLILYIDSQQKLPEPSSDIRPGVLTIQPLNFSQTDYIVQGYVERKERIKKGPTSYIVLSMKQDNGGNLPFTLVIPESLGTKAKNTKPSALLEKEYKRLRLRLQYKTFENELKPSFNPSELREWDIVAYLQN